MANHKKIRKVPHPSGDMKSDGRTKKAIDQLSEYVAETRDDQNAYYAELKRLLAQRRKTPKSENFANVNASLEIFKLGPSVFGSRKNFLRWLNTPSIALGRKTPIKLMLTKKAEIVRDELGRIEYGVLS